MTCDYVSYLVFAVTMDGIITQPLKVKVIMVIKPPKTITIEDVLLVWVILKVLMEKQYHTFTSLSKLSGGNLLVMGESQT